MKIQPFRYRIEENKDFEECNAVYDFIIFGSRTKPYKIEITIDELDDNKLVNRTCECPDHQFRGNDCKHIKECINILKDYNIEINDEKHFFVEDDIL